MKLILILGKILLLVCLPIILNATVTASLDKIAIYKGDRVTLSIKAVGDDIKFPNIVSIAGYRAEGTSSSSQMYIVNSQVTKSETKSYIFSPTKSIEVESFNITVDGKVEQTKPLYLKVVKPQTSKSGDKFIYKISLSKNKVYQGEAIRAILKFSYKIGTNPLDVNLEKFAPKHFWIKELSNPKAKEENGYVSQSINFLLFPQMAGKQTIDNQVINVATRQRKTGFVQWKKIISNRVNIEVLPLPDGLNVQGSYNITATADKLNIKENEPINLTIKIKGFGNIDDIEPLRLTLKDEVVYASKPEIKNILQDGKYGGEFIQKISIIAHKDFTIPTIEFKYFDIKTKKIKKIKTKSIDIKVESEIKNTPKIETKNISKIVQLPPKVIIQKEDEGIKYIYAIIGFIIGVVTFYIFTKKKTTTKHQLPIEKKIKKSKNNKAIYKVLLPYSQDKKLLNIMKDLEENIYNDGKNKIDKKMIIELFQEG